MPRWHRWLVQSMFYGPHPMSIILRLQQSGRLPIYQFLLGIDVIKNAMFLVASDDHCWPYLLFDLARMFHKPQARFIHVIFGSFSFVYALTLCHYVRLDYNKLVQWFDIHLNRDWNDPKQMRQSDELRTQLGAHFIQPGRLWLYFQKLGFTNQLFTLSEQTEYNNQDQDPHANHHLYNTDSYQNEHLISNNKHVRMMADHRTYAQHRLQTSHRSMLSRPSQVLTPNFLVDRLKLLLQIDRAHRALQTMACTSVVCFSIATSGYYATAVAPCSINSTLHFALSTVGYLHSLFAFYLYNRTLVLQTAMYLSDAIQLLHALRSLHKQLHLLATGFTFNARRRTFLLQRSLRHVQHVHGHFRHSSRYFNQVFGISFFVAFFTSVFLLFALVHFQTSAVEKSILICCMVMLIIMYNLLPSLINSSVQSAVSNPLSTCQMTLARTEGPILDCPLQTLTGPRHF